MTECAELFLPTDDDLGSPAKVPSDAGPILGRITKLMGESCGNQWPCVRFVTPHGSVFDGAGVIWLKLRRLDEFELARLREFERDALEKGVALYRGEIEVK